MKKILYILKHSPLGVGGGAKASLHYLEAFRKIFEQYLIDVLICEEYLQPKLLEYFSQCNINFIPVPQRSVWSKICATYSGVMHRFRKYGLKHLQTKEYEYCIFDHSSIAGSFVNVAAAKGIKTLVIHHNVESVYFPDNSNWLQKLLFLHHVKKNERESYLNCDFNIFLTSEDKYDFEQLYGLCEGKCCVQYVFECQNDIYMPKNLDVHCPLTIVISGSLVNVQNIDGICFFIDKLYPLISQKFKIIIAGQKPTTKIKEIIKGKSNIELIENPDNMDEIICRADIFLCPARLGSGIKVRVTDGLRNGLPVIAHKVSARGYNNFEKEGYLYSFNTDSEFADALSRVCSLLKNNPMIKYKISQFYISQCSFLSSVGNIRKCLNL